MIAHQVHNEVTKSKCDSEDGSPRSIRKLRWRSRPWQATFPPRREIRPYDGAARRVSRPAPDWPLIRQPRQHLRTFAQHCLQQVQILSQDLHDGRCDLPRLHRARHRRLRLNCECVYQQLQAGTWHLLSIPWHLRVDLQAPTVDSARHAQTVVDALLPKPSHHLQAAHPMMAKHNDGILFLFERAESLGNGSHRNHFRSCDARLLYLERFPYINQTQLPPRIQPALDILWSNFEV
jgi:hypothetical protein